MARARRLLRLLVIKIIGNAFKGQFVPIVLANSRTIGIPSALLSEINRRPCCKNVLVRLLQVRPTIIAKKPFLLAAFDVSSCLARRMIELKKERTWFELTINSANHRIASLIPY